jgi:ribulose-bisphosphate carboxylase large chain
MSRFYATYRVESPLPLEDAAAILAGEQSSGTFIKVPGESDELKERFGARVEKVQEHGTAGSPFLAGARSPENKPNPVYHQGEVVLSWSFENTAANLPVLLSTVAGGTFDLNAFSGIKVLDLEIPDEFFEVYQGPQFGIDGTRQLTGVSDRPIIGSIIKPCIGLKPEETAARVDALVQAGIDFIKDDELLGDHPQSPFEKRVEKVMQVINRHADKTGKKTMFAFNISGDMDDMLRRHDIVVQHGGTCVMTNILSVGLTGLAKLRRHSQVPIHGHRCGFGALNRCSYLGFEFPAYLKIWRLIGVDQVHTNGINNKFYESNESVTQSIRTCLTPMTDGRRILPVLGAGAWAGQAPLTYEIINSFDILFLCGGGILGHPGGLTAGVKSVQQGWEAATQGIDLQTFAKTHKELEQALEFFES